MYFTFMKFKNDFSSYQQKKKKKEITVYNTKLKAY